MSLDSHKEGDVVLCTVTQIDNANVLVTLDDSGLKGNIIFAEVSPGRIRNIREFVSVGKKIVCKILRKKDDHVELSLRRVTAKERNAVVDYYKQERVLSSMLKPVMGEKTLETMNKIKEEGLDIDRIRENPELLKKLVGSAQLEQLKRLFAVKVEEKEKVVQSKITIKSDAESGIAHIRDALATNEADISYLGSGQFLIRVKGKEYKSANIQLEMVLTHIKDKTKAHHLQLEIK